ncbi:MAG: hypothetical protein LUD51_07035 [Clostridia bacterium]|nr:hypothetical protein [Clostridia bacterium]
MEGLTFEGESIYSKGVFDAILALYNRGLLVLGMTDKPEAKRDKNGGISYAKEDALVKKALCRKLLDSRLARDCFMAGEDFVFSFDWHGNMVTANCCTHGEWERIKDGKDE